MAIITANLESGHILWKENRDWKPCFIIVGEWYYEEASFQENKGDQLMICSVRMESNLRSRWINGLIQISMQNIALEKTSVSCKYRKRPLLTLFTGNYCKSFFWNIVIFSYLWWNMNFVLDVLIVTTDYHISCSIFRAYSVVLKWMM